MQQRAAHASMPARDGKGNAVGGASEWELRPGIKNTGRARILRNALQQRMNLMLQRAQARIERAGGQAQKNAVGQALEIVSGRRIRTPDPLLPKQVERFSVSC